MLKRKYAFLFLIIFSLSMITLINGQGCSTRGSKDISGNEGSSSTNKNIYESNGGGYSGIIPIYDGVYGAPNDDSASDNISPRKELNVANTFVHFNGSLMSAESAGLFDLLNFVDKMIYAGSGQFRYRNLLGDEYNLVNVFETELERVAYNPDYLIYANQIYLYYTVQPHSVDQLFETKIFCRRIESDSNGIQTGTDIIIYQRSQYYFAKIVQGKMESDSTFSKYSSAELPVTISSNGQFVEVKGNHLNVVMPSGRGIRQGHANIKYSDSTLDESFKCLNEYF